MYILYWVLIVAGYGSLTITLYVIAMGIGSIRDKMRRNGNSDLKIEFFFICHLGTTNIIDIYNKEILK